MPVPFQQAPRRVFYVVVPVLASLLTLAAVELGLRLLRPVPYASEFNMYFEADPDTGHRLRPNSLGFFHEIPAHTNSHGHRDDETPLEKPRGTFRILVIGDSFTVGAGVAQEEAYPQVLETLLDQDPSAPVEVINAGVGGWTPFQYAQYYASRGERFDPDLVLVGFYVANDAFDSMRSVEELPTAVLGRRVRNLGRPWRPIAVTVVQAWLYSRSHLVRAFVNRSRVVIRRGELGYDPSAPLPRDTHALPPSYVARQTGRSGLHLPTSPGQQERAENGVSQIARIRSLADRRSIPTVVAVIPAETQVNRFLFRNLRPQTRGQRFDPSMPQQLLTAMFQERGIETIDLLADFQSHPERLYMNDAHWNPEGHALAARRIAEALRPLLPGPSPTDP